MTTIQQAYKELLEKEKQFSNTLSLLEDNLENVGIVFRVDLLGEGRVHHLPREFDSLLKKRVLEFAQEEIPRVIADLHAEYEKAVVDFAVLAKKAVTNEPEETTPFQQRVNDLQARAQEILNPKEKKE